MINQPTAFIKADSLSEGDTIVERFSTGSIRARIKVSGIGPCRTDQSNVHIVHETGKQDCHFRHANVEILER